MIFENVKTLYKHFFRNYSGLMRIVYDFAMIIMTLISFLMY